MPVILNAAPDPANVMGLGKIFEIAKRDGIPTYKAADRMGPTLIAEDLVIGGFGSARLSEFDLDIASPLETTRYMAPEAIAGGVAPASDWWSRSC